MAKYKPYSYAQGQFIPVHFNKQIQKGTFEYTLNYLIENELDLTIFDQRFRNDETGAPAYDPRILLKIILFAYSRGITSSRAIARCCEENVLFMALSANSRPHFTTIAALISSMDKEVVNLFLQVLLVCDQQNLIGKEMFAIDGCKLPSNASKEWSGTREDLKRKAEKMEKALHRMIIRHRCMDESKIEPEVLEREAKYKEKLKKSAAKIREWLGENDDRTGSSGKPVKSNITDNESAKIATSKGVIQGYVGVASVDRKHQVIVGAEAYGQGHETDLLVPAVETIKVNLSSIGEPEVLDTAQLVADSGYHTEKNMEYLFSKNIDGYVADKHFRKRDPRFITQERYKDLPDYYGSTRNGKKRLFRSSDFIFADDLSHAICPAGKRLYRSGSNAKVKDYTAYKFKGAKRDCLNCNLRRECLRHPERTEIRQLAYLSGRNRNGKERFTEKMKRKIDSTIGRVLYGMRLAVGEPPFAHIRSAMGLDRFGLRGKRKVNTQWNLFCMVHNLKKVHAFGTIGV
jgi:transposase